MRPRAVPLALRVHVLLCGVLLASALIGHAALPAEAALPADAAPHPTAEGDAARARADAARVDADAARLAADTASVATEARAEAETTLARARAGVGIQLRTIAEVTGQRDAADTRLTALEATDGALADRRRRTEALEVVSAAAASASDTAARDSAATGLEAEGRSRARTPTQTVGERSDGGGAGIGHGGAPDEGAPRRRDRAAGHPPAALSAPMHGHSRRPHRGRGVVAGSTRADDG